jgi:hypothetical protein
LLRPYQVLIHIFITHDPRKKTFNREMDTWVLYKHNWVLEVSGVDVGTPQLISSQNICIQIKDNYMASYSVLTGSQYHVLI